MSTNAPRENVSPSVGRTSAKSGAAAAPSEWVIPPFIGFIVLVVIALVIYAPVFHADFIWDDDSMLYENGLMHGPDGLSQIWFSTNQSDYFPMTYSSLWLEWHWWGMNAKGYHVINVLLHALSAVFLWRGLRWLKIPGAFWAALLFVVHPVNVESVAWIAERKNTLSMLFFALALLFYARFENSKAKLLGTKPTNDYWLALGCFTLALLSKTAVVMFPFVALGCAWWLHGKLTKKDLLRSLPFFGVAAVLAIATVWFQYNRAINTAVVNSNNFPTRLAIAGWDVWFYLSKALLPLKLTFVYPRWTVDWHNAIVYLPGVGVLATLAVLWVLQKRIGHGPFLGFAFFVVTLFPVLGFLNIYFFRYSFVADHYQYFSLLGIVALFCGVLTHFLQQRAAIIFIALAGVLSVLTWQQAHIYRNYETLWRDTLAKNPQCSMGESNWGYRLAEGEHRYAEGIEHYVAALKIDPADAGTHYNYGVALINVQRVEEGASEFREALKWNPDNAYALQSLAWLEATSKYAKIRNPEHAVQLARRGVEVTKGKDEWKFDTLAAALAACGKFEEAIETQQHAVDLAQKKGDQGAATDMGQRLALYRMRQPYRESD